MQAGCSISPINRKYAATLSAIVFDNNNNSRYLLGANHTLTDFNKLPINKTLIVQPGVLIAGKNIFNTVAILSKFVPITFDYNNNNPSINYVDCAIAKILPYIKTSPNIYEIGLVNGITEAELGMPVKKFGITSGYTEGKIKAIHVTRTQKSPYGGTSTYYEQIITTGMSTVGDSGALVLNFQNKAVGLISCAGYNYSYLNPIEYVLRYLNIHF